MINSLNDKLLLIKMIANLYGNVVLRIEDLIQCITVTLGNFIINLCEVVIIYI